MDILIIGDTAREHALAWKFAESRRTGKLYCTSPYSGVDTLCEKIEPSLTNWRKAHPVDLVVGEDDACIYRTSFVCPKDAIHITVDCLTDGSTIVPLPAVRVCYDAAGEAFAAETPARAYTCDMAHRAYCRHFLPHIRAHGRKASGYSGVFRFEMAICEDEPELLSVSHGFGEMDALALLPILRCELAPLLTACADGTLTREMVRLNTLACVVLMLGAERSGVHIRGLSNVAKNTGVFMGAVQFQGEGLLTAGRRALFVCGRGQDVLTAARAAQRGADEIVFDGIIRPSNVW